MHGLRYKLQGSGISSCGSSLAGKSKMVNVWLAHGLEASVPADEYQTMYQITLIASASNRLANPGHDNFQLSVDSACIEACRIGCKCEQPIEQQRDAEPRTSWS
jgi:hypothetical protein